jgi:predicted GIY-YIG superfamily endonuclease
MSHPDPLPIPGKEPRLPGKKREQIREWLDESSENYQSKYAVYVLDCTPPSKEEQRTYLQNEIQRSRERIENSSKNNKHDLAKRDAAEADQVYYVGKANDVAERINRHFGGSAKGGSWFPHLFSPKLLVEVYWFETESEARAAESRIAEKVDQEKESRYVYQD